MSYRHQLADDEKRELLRIARATLREHSFSGRIPPGKPHRESLLAPAAVFVTLHLAGYYNRFDIFKLTVDRSANRPVRFEDGPASAEDQPPITAATIAAPTAAMVAGST